MAENKKNYTNEDEKLISINYIKEKSKGIVTNILIEMGIMPNFLGFKYSVTAVIIMLDNEFENKERINMMELYDLVAKKHKTTFSKVEKDIRYVVAIANAMHFKSLDKLTNSVFIELLKNETKNKILSDLE